MTRPDHDDNEGFLDPDDPGDLFFTQEEIESFAIPRCEIYELATRNGWDGPWIRCDYEAKFRFYDWLLCPTCCADAKAQTRRNHEAGFSGVRGAPDPARYRRLEDAT